MEQLLLGARRLRRRVGGALVWRALRPAYWSVASRVTRRTGVSMRLADGENYRLDARLFAWQPHTYEPEVVGAILDALPAGGMFMDVGAHVGLFTLIACRRLGGSGRVLAIEPSPQNADLLRRHVTLNACESQVTVVEALVGDQVSGSVRFVCQPGECTANSLAYEIPGGRSTVVPMTTVDAIVAGPGGRLPDVIKIDVEGYEHHVLCGARKTLESGRPTVVCALHPDPLQRLGTSAARLIGDMREWGYAAFDLAGRPVERAGFVEVVFRKVT